MAGKKKSIMKDNEQRSRERKRDDIKRKVRKLNKIELKDESIRRRVNRKMEKGRGSKQRKSNNKERI